MRMVFYKPILQDLSLHRIFASELTNSEGFQGGSVVKNPPANAGDVGDMGLISRSGGSPGEGKGNPLQYSCLEKPMDREAWQDHMGLKRVRHN